MGNPSQSYRASLAIWDHTVLPATWHSVPRQPGRYSIYVPRRMEGWVELSSLIAARSGVEPTTAWSQVRRPNRYAAECSSSNSNSSSNNNNNNKILILTNDYPNNYIWTSDCSGRVVCLSVALQGSIPTVTVTWLVDSMLPPCWHAEPVTLLSQTHSTFYRSDPQPVTQLTVSKHLFLGGSSRIFGVRIFTYQMPFQQTVTECCNGE